MRPVTSFPIHLRNVNRLKASMMTNRVAKNIRVVHSTRAIIVSISGWSWKIMVISYTENVQIKTPLLLFWYYCKYCPLCYLRVLTWTTKSVIAPRKEIHPMLRLILSEFWMKNKMITAPKTTTDFIKSGLSKNIWKLSKSGKVIQKCKVFLPLRQ